MKLYTKREKKKFIIFAICFLPLLSYIGYLCAIYDEIPAILALPAIVGIMIICLLALDAFLYVDVARRLKSD